MIDIKFGRYEHKKTKLGASVYIETCLVFPNRTGSITRITTNEGWTRTVREKKDLKDWKLIKEDKPNVKKRIRYAR